MSLATLSNSRGPTAPPVRRPPTSALVHFDPPAARALLAKNTRNRPISQLHVGRIMDDMIRNRWQYNGETIKISYDDELLDGQHRLTALSLLPDDFGSIPLLVVRGLKPESQDTMDQARRRSAADQLHINNIADDPKTVAGAIRVYVSWTENKLFGDAKLNRISNTAVVQWAKDNPHELATMNDICCQDLKRVKARPSITLAVLVRFAVIDPEAAKEFTTGLYTGAGLIQGNPILTLRERLDRIQTQRVKISDRDCISFFVIAWNAWRENRALTKFQRPAGGIWSAGNFPEPV